MSQTPRFRGADFEGKWSLGSWAEQKIINSINASDLFRAVSYGRSEVSSAKNKEERQEEYDLYKERESSGKRPDLLVFEREIYDELMKDGKYASLLADLSNNPESEIQEIVPNSLLAIESKASLWEGKKMSHFGRDWSNKVGRRNPLREVKNWSAPTVMLKEEELNPLNNWESHYRKPVYIVHIFYDVAYILSFSKLKEYIAEGVITVKQEVYDNNPKDVFSVYYGLANEFGIFADTAKIVPRYYQTKGGKFKPDLSFEGGEIVIILNKASVLVNE